MKAVKQCVEFENGGKRPTDIYVRGEGNRMVLNPAFRKRPIQCTESCCEIWLTDDDAAVEPYRGIEGVTILENDTEVKAAVDAIHAAMPTKPRIENELLAMEFCRQSGRPLQELVGLYGEPLARKLAEWGVPGVNPGNPPAAPTLAELRERGK